MPSGNNNDIDVEIVYFNIENNWKYVYVFFYMYKGTMENIKSLALQRLREYENTYMDYMFTQDNKPLSCYNNNPPAMMEIPVINVLSISMDYFGGNMSSVAFLVGDTFIHKGDYPRNDLNEEKAKIYCKENPVKPKVIPFEDVKCTYYIQSPNINSVLLAEVEPLVSKFKDEKTMYQVVFYGMTKYILCRLLYGDFNVDYLLRRHSKKFRHDLTHSRYWRFREFFELPKNKYLGKYYKK